MNCNAQYSYLLKYTCHAVICHVRRRIGPIQKAGTLWSLWIEAFAEVKAKWAI